MGAPTAPALLAVQGEDPFAVARDALESPLLHAAAGLCVAVIAILWLGLAIRAFGDAARRGATPLFWGLVALLFPYLGYLFWSLVRPPEYAEEREERRLRREALLREADLAAGERCPACEGETRPDYAFCPLCGATLREPCASCEAPLELGWRHCPRCGAPKGERAFGSQLAVGDGEGAVPGPGRAPGVRQKGGARRADATLGTAAGTAPIPLHAARPSRRSPLREPRDS
jgi:hypothetical protein